MKKHLLVIFLAVLFLTPLSAIAGFTKSYLMAFHTCGTPNSLTDCADPSLHQTQIAESNDGTNWTAVPGLDTFPTGTSVPDLIRRGSYIYVYTPGHMYKVKVGNGKILVDSPVTILDDLGNFVNMVDPSPILDPATNKIVLFYLVTNPPSAPGVCIDTTVPCTIHIRAAIEQGTNGTSFREVPMSGTDILINPVDTVSQMATDPDIFADASGYKLLVSRGTKVQMFESPTLTGAFTQVSTLTNGLIVDGSTSSLTGVSAGYYTAGTYWIYAHDSQSNS